MARNKLDQDNAARMTKLRMPPFSGLSGGSGGSGIGGYGQNYALPAPMQNPNYTGAQAQGPTANFANLPSRFQLRHKFGWSPEYEQAKNATLGTPADTAPPTVSTTTNPMLAQQMMQKFYEQQAGMNQPQEEMGGGRRGVSRETLGGFNPMQPQEAGMIGVQKPGDQMRYSFQDPYTGSMTPSAPDIPGYMTPLDQRQRDASFQSQSDAFNRQLASTLASPEYLRAQMQYGGDPHKQQLNRDREDRLRAQMENQQQNVGNRLTWDQVKTGATAAGGARDLPESAAERIKFFQDQIDALREGQSPSNGATLRMTLPSPMQNPSAALQLPQWPRPGQPAGSMLPQTTQGAMPTFSDIQRKVQDLVQSGLTSEADIERELDRIFPPGWDQVTE